MFWAGFVLLGTGGIVNHIWADLPPWPLALLGSMAFVVMLVAVMLAYLFRCRLATTVLLAWLVALVYFAGFGPCVAVVLIGLAALGVGSLVVSRQWDSGIALPILAGLALVCGLVGWLLPFPIHYRAVYGVALLAMVVLRRRAVANFMQAVPVAWSGAVAQAPVAAWFAVMVMGVASTCAWLPTTHFDDQAYHLALPMQLLHLGYYQMNAGSNVWAVNAWAADVLQGIAWLIGGSQSRGAVDILWFGLTSGLIWKLCEQLELKPWLRWLAVALYASLPLTAGALCGMQTEGPTAGVAVALAWLIQQSRGQFGRRRIAIIALLFGLLLGLKVSNLMIAGPLGLWLLWSCRGRLPWRFMLLALMLALLTAGSSYAYAYLLTGNPVLPLFNSVFHSPYFGPYDFHDGHWDSGFRWNIIWNVVFHTAHYVEGGNGSAGFVLIALSGSLIVALAGRRSRPLAMAGIVGLLLPLSQIQYVRYAHPAMALLIPVMLCGIPQHAAGRRHLHGLALAALAVVDLMYVPVSDWQLRGGALWQFLTQPSSTFLDSYAPMGRLAEVVDDLYGAQARVLVAADSAPFTAEFAGRGFIFNWYDPELARLAQGVDRSADGAGWIKLIERTGADLIVVQPDNISASLEAAISRYDGSLVDTAGNLELWVLHDPGVAGIAVPAPPHTVTVSFDTASAPTAPTLVTANIELVCKPQKIPVVVSWSISVKDRRTRQQSMWAWCQANGRVDASFALASSSQVTKLTATAYPAQSVDLGLGLSSARASFRQDLTAERDLAWQWRNGLIRAVKEANARRLARRRAGR